MTKNNYVKGIVKAIKSYMPELYEVYSPDDYQYAQQIPNRPDLYDTERRQIYVNVHKMTQDLLKRSVKIRPEVITKRQQLDDKPVIFVCWFQGYEAMPEVVKLCYESILHHSNGHKVILITTDNLTDYIDIDKNILNALNEGSISYTAFSDYIRVCLLAKYEGIWIDSTVCLTDDISETYFTEPFILPKSQRIYDSKLFVRVFLNTYFYTKIVYLLGGTDNRIYSLVKDIYEQWFATHTGIINYFFINDVFEFVIQNDEQSMKLWSDCPINNVFIEAFNNCKYDISYNMLMKYLPKQTIFKLTYKGMKLNEGHRLLLSL